MTKLPSLPKARQTEYEAQHERLHKLVADNLDAYWAALDALATGIWTEQAVPGPDGNMIMKVYQKEPNLLAAQYLINRSMGSPTQRKEELSMAGTPQDFAELMRARRERFEAEGPQGNTPALGGSINSIPGIFKVVDDPGQLTPGPVAATEGAERPTQQPADDLRARFLNRPKS